MRPLTALLIPAVAVAVLVGCSDDNGVTGPQTADLAGTWEATQWAYTPPVGGAIDLVAGGGAMVITVQANGQFAGEVDIPDFQTGEVQTVPVSGQITITGANTLDVVFNPPSFFNDLIGVTFTLQANTLTWSLPETTIPGTEIPASLSVSMRRI